MTDTVNGINKTDLIITTAIPLSKNKKSEIKKKLEKKYGKIKAVYHVNKAIIGGIIIFDGDKVYDGSVRTQLNNYPIKMAETDFIKEQLEESKQYKKHTSVRSAGVIVSCNDGVLQIEGVNKVKNGELLSVGEHDYALALNLEEKSVGAILLSASNRISAGDIVHTTGKIVNVPSGRALLGRVIDPLGKPLDGKSDDIKTTRYRNLESPAPTILDRAKVNSPLYTGIKAIDSMIPIGKGQRELIIGDRQTGKTALAIDTIINQKGKNVICIYVAIGQKTSSVAKLIRDLEEHDAMNYTVIVSSTAGQPAPLQYLAPYTGTAIAEDFMYNGKDVLIVYDDLSKHAVAYRTISLLLKRPSGREAFPGDIFYIHSKLLERSAKLSQDLGGGSLTALPIIETLSGDISAYIPTNVISITDGQIYLENELFHAGIRPAINVGLSVSRVGGAAQCPAIRKVSGKLRLQLAHYRDMQLFARFGADLDSSTKAILLQGEKLTESLKQPQYSPADMEDTVLELIAIQSEGISQIDVKDIEKTIKGFLTYMHTRNKQIVEKISISEDVDDETKTSVIEAFLNYINKFVKK